MCQLPFDAPPKYTHTERDTINTIEKIVSLIVWRVLSLSSNSNLYSHCWQTNRRLVLLSLSKHMLTSLDIRQQQRQAKNNVCIQFNLFADVVYDTLVYKVIVTSYAHFNQFRHHWIRIITLRRLVYIALLRKLRARKTKKDHLNK